METLFSQSSGRGPDIVLLHGWGIHGGIWQYVIEKLAEEFRVTVIDLPGFGRSKAVSNYSIENIIDLILQIVPTRAIWIGWSLGGLIATRTAALFPDRVHKLICVGSNPKFIKEGNWPGVNYGLFDKFAAALNKDQEATLVRFLMLQFYGMSLDRNLFKWLGLNLFLYGKPSLETLNASLDLLVTLDLRNDLKSMHCPILYLLGELDRLVPVKLQHTLQHEFPNIKTVVISKASHVPFITHEKDFLHEVRSFVHEQ